jgi:hypothetical protein
VRRAAGTGVALTVLALTVAIGLPAGTSLGASRTPALHTVHFSGSFVPQQITAAASSLWILGSTSPSTFTDCALERLDPSTLEAQSYALPQCATGITSGNGRVYLLVNQVQPNTNTRDYRIEVFDPATLSALVLPPVVLQNIGSAVAHTDLSFGDGSLWLYGYALGGKNEVVQISPDSGDVENTIGNAPEIGGVYPAVVGDSAGEWLGGGPGAPAGLEWVHAGTGTATNMTLVTGGRSGSIVWLSATAGRVWAGVARYGGAPGTTIVTTRLVALDEEGHVAVRSPWESVGLYPVVATPDGHLWDVEYPARCGGSETLLEIDPSTGVSRAAARLNASPAACNDEDAGSELAAIGSEVFVLFPTAEAGSVLYRATT